MHPPPAAAPPPPSLSDKQVVFDSRDDQGWLVGFWCPPIVGSSLNVPGFHFHFLSYDKQRGGHLLQLEMEQGTAHLQEVRRPAGRGFAESSDPWRTLHPKQHAGSAWHLPNAELSVIHCCTYCHTKVASSPSRPSGAGMLGNTAPLRKPWLCFQAFCTRPRLESLIEPGVA